LDSEVNDLLNQTVLVLDEIHEKLRTSETVDSDQLRL